jgi:thiopeptide-type bacteriocin biosynthesis protein
MILFNFVVLRAPAESLNNAFEVPLTLNPIFTEGLYLASHDFYKQYKKNNNLTDLEKNKIKISLLKYWLRASFRCTPFGVFAGNAVIPLTENETQIVLRDAMYHKRQVRLDMGYIYFLTSELEKLTIIQDQIYLFPNNSIYHTPLDVRYTESFLVNFFKDYKLTAVEKSDYLLFVLDKSIKGFSINDLSSLLSDFANVDFDEAKQFIMEMWSAQLLVSELEPCITGENPLERLISLIQRYSGIDLLKKQLNHIFHRLNTPKEGADYYIEIEGLIKEIFYPPENLKNFIQTDLFLSSKKQHLNKNIIESIVGQVDDLMSLSRVVNNTEISSFKEKFIGKYENKIVPLSIALDSDLGIGYAGAYNDISGGGLMIDDIGYFRNEKIKQRSLDNLDQYVINKYLEYIKGDKPCIEITESELQNLKSKSKDIQFPESIAVIGSLIKTTKILDKDNFLFTLLTVSGPSGVNLLGRFTHGNEDFLNRIKEVLCLEEKEYPEIIFAEIVHQPQTRIGNILLRPVLRNYEIPYVGKSGLQLDKQILISDLHICVRNDEVILVSKKFNKRVIPRLTTAHDFTAINLPIYKFLCDLQHQNLSLGAIWDWSSLGTLKYSPRVIYKNVVLEKAKWRIEISDIVESANTDKEYEEIVSEYVIDKKIPKRVLLHESNNQILIDFGIKESMQIFLNYLKKNKNILLEEFLFTNENCVVEDNKGHSYTNEIIIPVHNTSSNARKMLSYRFSEELTDKKYYPGSEWLFFKVFCSAKTADRLLTEYLLPFIETCIEKKLFDRFFFVRYNEGGSNLRIRFYNQNITKQNTISIEFTNLFRVLLDTNIIERIMLDTYIQETERYGGYKLIEESEELFGTDSLATLRILNLLQPGIENNYRVFFAMRSIDALMNDFNLSLLSKLELAKKISEQFYNEFGSNPALQKNLNKKFNSLRKEIFSHMDLQQDFNNDITEISEIFKHRSIQNKEIVARILNNIATQNKKTLSDLLVSYFHMSINRLFISQQRKYELVIYHFLERYYTSMSSITLKDQ